MLNKNSGYTNSGNLIILQPITQNADKETIPAVFKVTRPNEKVEEGAEVELETVSSVTGDVFRVETYKNDWENPKTKKKQTTYGFKVLMRDGEANEIYLLDCRLNMLTRDLANKLMGLTKFTGVTIGVYQNRKTRYNTAVVKTGENKEDLVGWKYRLDEIPKPLEVKNPVTGEVLQRVYTEVDEFYLNALNEFARANNLVKKDQSVAAVRQAVEEEQEVGVEVSDDETVW